MIFKLAIKNIVSRKSSIVIILFMMFTTMLLCIANAVFDSTEQGVAKSFIHSFTGDLIIRPKTTVPLSLFGDETPVTGELTEIEKLIPYQNILSELNAKEEIKSCIPQITGVSAIEANNKRIPVYLFGVSGREYLSAMDAISILEGTFYSLEEKGVMVSQKIAQQLDVKIGDSVQFVVVDGPTFRIRSAKISAIYTYKVDNPIFDKFVLVSPNVVRSIMDIVDTIESDIEISNEKSDLLEDDLNMDDLFSSVDDVEGVFEEDFSIEQEVMEENNIEKLVESTSWNFIICNLQNGENSKKVIRELNRIFKKMDWPVEAVNWRYAAGSTALYLYWMRIIFNVGIIIVLAAGFIVVNNTLVINVLDRTIEIGTIRALGGGKSFISLQCMLETLILAFIAASLGCFLGVIISNIITSLEITFTNSFLIQLFGSTTLVSKMSVFTIIKIFTLILCLGIVGWVYPVLAALKVNPIQAMQGVK